MNPVERFLKRGNKDGLAPADFGFRMKKNFDHLKNSLNYLIQEYNHLLLGQMLREKVETTVLFVSNIVYIYLRYKDYENALEFLGIWLDVEPENEEVQLLHKYVDYLVMELAREKRLGIVRSEKSKFFCCF